MLSGQIKLSRRIDIVVILTSFSVVRKQDLAVVDSFYLEIETSYDAFFSVILLFIFFL